MVNNRLYKYNKMYYVHSLDEDDKNPFFDIPAFVNNELEKGNSFCESISVSTLGEWDATIERIIKDSSSTSIPILFIECHGDKSGNLIIGGKDSKNKVRVKDLIQKLKILNEKCNQKILLLTAICYGLYCFRKMYRLGDSFPCSCLIGSFTVQSTFDIEERYRMFLSNLLGCDKASSVESAFAAMNRVYKNVDLQHNWGIGKRYVMLTGRGRFYASKT